MLTILLAAAAVQAAPQDDARRAGLRAELAAAVDLPAPDGRARAAAALAKRRDVALADWLDAARGLQPAPGGPDSPGRHSVRVDLPVLDAVEPTTIHLYLPESRDAARPAPLLLALHGAGGDGAGMLGGWQAAADALGMIVCAPTDPGADAGYAFTPRERAAALAALRWARRHYDVDEDRIHLFGASRGGHLAWDLGVRHPDLWASVSPCIGGPTFVSSGGRNNLRYVENLAATPIRDLQGADDDPKLIHNLRLAFTRLSAAGAADAALLVQEGYGHAFDPSAVDWTAFLGAAVRDPFPASIRLRAAWEIPARAHWAEIARYGKEVQEEFRITIGPGDDWEGWDHERRVRHVMGLADAATADLRIAREGALFRVEAAGVAVVRLQLPDGFDAPAGRIAWTDGGKERKAGLRSSAAILLADFVERFDRSFLPVAEAEFRL